MDRIQADGVTCFLADIYVKNIEAFETAFAKGAFKKGSADLPARTATANGAKFAVTGDHCSARRKGVVVRNGRKSGDIIYFR